jgi:hypothetical protein
MPEPTEAIRDTDHDLEVLGHGWRGRSCLKKEAAIQAAQVVEVAHRAMTMRSYSRRVNR